MAERLKKRPRDPLALAKMIGDIATGQTSDTEPDNRNPAAVELGRLGGKAHAAMESKVTDRLWSLEDMVALVDEWEANQNAENSN